MRYRRAPALILTALAIVIAVALYVADGTSSAPGSDPTESGLTGAGILTAPAAGADKHRIRSIICSVFTGSRCGPAIRVATCESWLEPRAVSRTGDYGLFQANYSAHHWDGESRAEFARRHFNIRYHIRWAFRLSRGGSSWAHWTCKP